MYPKVKVREETEEQEDDPLPASWKIFLKGFQSLSLHDSSNSPAAGHKDAYMPPTMTVPKIHISSSEPKTSAAAAEKKANTNNKVPEENKMNIKPSSVLPPRAVLSSPENDGMVGSKKKIKSEILSSSKTHDACQNRHVKCKVTPRTMAFGNPVNLRRDLKEAARSKKEPPTPNTVRRDE